MNVYSLLVDLGGTDIKFALADGDKLLEETITRWSFPLFLDDDPKSFEPTAIIEIVDQGIESYINSSLKPNRILLTGQMGCWIATSQSGDYQSNVLSWQASSPVGREFLKTLYEPNFVSENKPLLGTGNEDWSGAPWRTFAAHLSNQLPSSPRILFHTLLSWVAWELTGRAERIVHNSDAAATGLFNLTDNDWLGNFTSGGFDVEFPKVSSNLCKVGLYNFSDIPVYVGIGDQQASLIGAGLEESLYIINAGTGGQVARQVKSLTSGSFKTRPFFDGNYLETITHIPSGRFLSQLRDFLNKKEMKIVIGNGFGIAACQMMSPK
jgi:xylulokinase